MSQAVIVRAARQIVDEEGVDRLTMRRLADAVGTTPMALYHHVADKDALLLLLLDDFAAAIARPRLPADPRRRVVTIFRALHDGFASCPWIVEVITDNLMSEAALWWIEHIIEALVAAGLTQKQAVHAYRTLWYYTAGELLLRASAARRRAEPGPIQRDEVFGRIDADEYPQLGALGPDWVRLSARDTYREGLEALVTGLLPPTSAPEA